jgi:hypothetical protein
MFQPEWSSIILYSKAILLPEFLNRPPPSALRTTLTRAVDNNPWKKVLNLRELTKEGNCPGFDPGLALTLGCCDFFDLTGGRSLLLTL